MPVSPGVGTWLLYYSSEQLALKIGRFDAKAVYFDPNSTKISSACPHKNKVKQCECGTEKEWCGFFAKAWPHGMSFCTQEASVKDAIAC